MHTSSRWPEILRIAGIAVGVAAGAVGYTTKVIGHKGIYSPQQLPEERQTPFFDEIDDLLGDDEK